MSALSYSDLSAYLMSPTTAPFGFLLLLISKLKKALKENDWVFYKAIFVIYYSLSRFLVSITNGLPLVMFLKTS